MLGNFDIMSPHDELAVGGNAYVLAAPGKEYVAYLPRGGDVRINLSSTSGNLRYSWFNTRSFMLGKVNTISGGSIKPFHAPDTDDWVLWIRTARPATQSSIDSGTSGYKN
jgi:hypothetical protein